MEVLRLTFHRTGYEKEQRDRAATDASNFFCFSAQFWAKVVFYFFLLRDIRIAITQSKGHTVFLIIFFASTLLIFLAAPEGNKRVGRFLAGRHWQDLRQGSARLHSAFHSARPRVWSVHLVSCVSSFLLPSFLMLCSSGRWHSAQLSANRRVHRDTAHR